jgi:hypothetical protein
MNYKRTFRKNVILGIVVSAIIAVLLNLWYIIPFLHEYGSGIAVAGNWNDFSGTFNSAGAFLWQVFNIFPYTGSSIGAQYMNIESYREQEMSYSLGAPLIALIVFALIRLSLNYRADKENEKENLRVKFYTQLFIVALLSIYMASVHFPWDAVKRIIPAVAHLIQSIQFPWRFLGISSFVLVILAGGVCEMLMDFGFKKEYLVGFCTSILLLSVISASYYMTNICKDAKWEYLIDDVYYGDEAMGAEYIPMECDFTTTYEYFEPYSQDPVQITGWQRQGNDLYADIRNEAGKDTFVTCPVFFYYGYVARDVGTGEAFTISKNESGYVNVAIPDGYDGKICIYFSEPFFWRISEIVSLLTAVSVLCVVIKSFFGKKMLRKE